MATIWTLKKGGDIRVRAGHPWVFSNELLSSPKEISPGGAVELRDHKGQFVGHGYGNPHSLIAFRLLSTNPNDKVSSELLMRKLLNAWKTRTRLGLTQSFRLCFAEGDYLPGLIVDRYLTSNKKQILALQVLTAGIENLLKNPVAVLNQLVDESFNTGLSAVSWADTAVVLRNDVNIRKLEGMAVQEPQLIKETPGLDLNDCEFLLDTFAAEKTLTMRSDLFQGQKTGFFLDQRQNILNFIDLLSRSDLSRQSEPLRILDLCCYVGQWSSQISHFLHSRGIPNVVTQVDVSSSALSFAKRNAQAWTSEVESLELDVVHELDSLESKKYDIVIADPPAFIKAKKDIPTGSHAYLKMNTHAFRLAKEGGFVVSCSCSGLLIETEFLDILRKSQMRNGFVHRAVAYGGHSPDHPVRLSFPEGKYLKMITHFKVY